MAQPGSGDEVGASAARRLMRGGRRRHPATAAEGGQPFASLVTPAVAPDGAVLLWLSTLSEHTRQLAARAPLRPVVPRARPRTEPADRPARHRHRPGCARSRTPALKARLAGAPPLRRALRRVRRFGLWRIGRAARCWCGGFARAHRLRAADLRPGPDEAPPPPAPAPAAGRDPDPEGVP